MATYQSDSIWKTGGARLAQAAAIGMFALCSALSHGAHAQEAPRAPLASASIAATAAASQHFSDMARYYASNNEARASAIPPSLTAATTPKSDLSVRMDRFKSMTDHALSAQQGTSFQHPDMSPEQNRALANALASEPTLGPLHAKMRADAKAALEYFREEPDLDQALSDLGVFKSFREAQTLDEHFESLPREQALLPRFAGSEHASSLAISEVIQSGGMYLRMDPDQAATIIASKALVGHVAGAVDKDQASAALLRASNADTQSAWHDALDDASAIAPAKNIPSFADFSTKLSNWRHVSSEAPAPIRMRPTLN